MYRPDWQNRGTRIAHIPLDLHKSAGDIPEACFLDHSRMSFSCMAQLTPWLEEDGRTTACLYECEDEELEEVIICDAQAADTSLPEWSNETKQLLKATKGYVQQAMGSITLPGVPGNPTASKFIESRLFFGNLSHRE